MNQEQNTPANIGTEVAHAQAEKTPAKAKPAQAKVKLGFVMLQGFRPSNGNALYAHTAAVIDLMNMRKGAKVPRATLTKIMGETAVKHHLNTTGFLAQDATGVSLSAIGRDNPHWLKVDPELHAACVAVLTTGKVDARIIKNPSGIKAL